MGKWWIVRLKGRVEHNAPFFSSSEVQQVMVDAANKEEAIIKALKSSLIDYRYIEVVEA